MKTEIMEPTAIFTPFGGRVEIRMYGKQTGDWSLKPLDYENAGKEKLLNRIASITYPDIERIWAPRPTMFNALIVEPTKMTLRGIGHHRGAEKTHTVCILCAGPAEGVEIMSPKNCAAFFFPADCAVIVLYDPESGKTVASHAGRDSLIDRQFLLTGNKSRKHISVVDAMIDAFSKDTDTSNLRAFICGGINAHPYQFLPDSEHIIYNLVLLRFLGMTTPNAVNVKQGIMYISITALIEEQLFGHGIRPENIGMDCSDPVDDKDVSGKYTWWSHTRWLQEGHKGPDGRNGILIIRRW